MYLVLALAGDVWAQQIGPPRETSSRDQAGRGSTSVTALTAITETVYVSRDVGQPLQRSHDRSRRFALARF
jgi:hypothetical protein